MIAFSAQRPVFDPTAYPFTGYWRASYPGTQWPAQATAGISSTTGTLISNGVGPPTVGATQNGYASADFVSQHALGSTVVMTTLFGSSATNGTVVGLMSQRTLLAVGSPNIDSSAQMFSDSNGFLGVAISTNGAQAWIQGGGVYHTTAAQVISTSTYYAYRMRWDASNTVLGLTINNGTEVTAVAGAPGFAGGTLLVGICTGGVKSIDGTMLELGMLASTMSDIDWNKYREYLNFHYALAV